MSNIEKIKQKLSKLNTFFITVIDTATEKKWNVLPDEINRHGGIENYLKSLYTKGIKEVYIEPRVKNGSSHKLHGVPFKLLLGNKPQQTSTTEALPVAASPVTQHHHEPQMPGLMGVGLGQYMEAHSAMRALERLERDYSELKSKYETVLSEKERLKESESDLKRTIDKLEIKSESKGLLDGIDINQALPVLVGLIKQTPAPGLNAPAQKQLSGYKEALRNSIEQDTMPDAIVEKLYKVLEHYVTNNQKFVNEFESLINQTNLKPVKDA